MFAKLFDTDIGQILVKIDDGDSGPEVRYFFEPEGLGVCSFVVYFSDDGWDEADKLFDSVDNDHAVRVVSNLMNKMSSSNVDGAQCEQ